MPIREYRLLTQTYDVYIWTAHFSLNIMKWTNADVPHTAHM